MVDLPEPRAGLVVRYSYLWHRESMQGQDEGRKDRPCAMILATKDGHAAVVPITTSKPDLDTPAVELPASIGKQLGLGDKRSWIVVDEANLFRWPGEDIRRATPESWHFGQLPPNFTKSVIQSFQSQRGRLKTIRRDEVPPKKDWGKKASKPLKPPPAPKPTKDPGRSR